MADYLDIDRFLELQDTLIDFKMNEASGNVVSTGVDNDGLQGGLSLPATGTPTYQQAGPTIGDNLLAIDFDGVGDYFQLLATGFVNTSLDTFGPGFGFIIKVPPISAKGTFFSSAQDDHSRFVEMSILADGSIEVDTMSTAGRYREVSTTTGLDDNNWHFIWVDNYQDGNGMSMTIDSVAATLTRTLTGAATVDQWYTLVQSQYPVSQDNLCIGATAGTTPGTFFEGQINRIFSLVHRRFRVGDILTAYWNKLNNTLPTDELGRTAMGGPFHWWQMQEAAAPLLDTGMAFSQISAGTVTGTPGFQTAGPPGAGRPPFSVDFDGVNEFIRGDNPAGAISMWPYGDAGVWMANFIANTAVTGVPYGFTSTSSSTNYFRWALFADPVTRSMQVLNSNVVGIFYEERLRVPDFPAGTWFNLVDQSPSGGPWEHFIDGAVPTTIFTQAMGGWNNTIWWQDNAALPRINFGAFKRGGTADESWFDGQLTNCAGWCNVTLVAADVDVILNGPPVPPGGGEFFDELLLLNPDWYWRGNATSAPVIDRGVAQVRPGPTPPPVNADTITENGAPTYSTPGPLPGDASNAAIFLDGVGDSFEVGVNGAAGQLSASLTGTFGGFFSRNSNASENIMFSIGNDAYTSFFQVGFNDDRVELIVQSSSGNRATFTSGKALFLDTSYIFPVVTCDGASYKMYINGSLDPTATVTLTGTAVEGDWLAGVTADQTAIGAKADSGFTTVTHGRWSEMFLFDGATLSGAQVDALWAAAIRDGALGTANPVGVVSFQDVTFKNGAFADIRVENSLTTFQQVVQANRCKFHGGAQGSATYKPRIASFKGPVYAQFRGCDADLQATPVMGRGGIVGSAIDTTAISTADGSMIVSDCDFKQLGFWDGTDFLSAVMCEAGFGMSVVKNRFTDCYTTAVGWLSDAQRVAVVDNQIVGTTNVGTVTGGIYSAQGLNARIGNTWLVRGNQLINTTGHAINVQGLQGGLLPGTDFARNVAILDNNVDNAIAAGNGVRVTQVADVVVADNKANFVTDGVRVGLVEDQIAVDGNEVSNHSGTAVICSEATVQAAELIVGRNMIKGLGPIGSGITIANVARTFIKDNKLSALALGIQLGAVSIEADIGGNEVLDDVLTPFALLAGAINSLTIGENQISTLGNATLQSITANAMTVLAPFHTLNSAAVTDLDTVNGPSDEGYLVILQRAAGAAAITVKDGVDNLNLAGDFIMSTVGSQIWLVRRGADWNELARFVA